MNIIVIDIINNHFETQLHYFYLNSKFNVGTKDSFCHIVFRYYE